MIARAALLALLALGLGLSGCGRKGDLTRPEAGVMQPR